MPSSLLIMHDLAHFFALSTATTPEKFCFFTLLTVIFAVLGRVVRGVTTAGALAGGSVCFALLLSAGIGGFVPLLTVFVLTWVSTRLGRARKVGFGTGESGGGRDALQVFANLGTAVALAVAFALVWSDRRLLIAMAAALAEAAADTMSSEIGQAFGGTPRLVTNWSKVAAGTNGAITLAGTLAGFAGAVTVGLVGVRIGLFPWRGFPICAGAGLAGMLVDSFLGATLERRGLLGNNGVNFISTVMSAALAIVPLLKIT
jgi:uncharacterized protein (TIGR00297 family)